MYKTEKNGDAFKCYGSKYFPNYACPEQENPGTLEEFRYGYGVYFDEKGQMRSLWYCGYPKSSWEYFGGMGLKHKILSPNLKWNIDFDENGKVTGQVGKISDSDLQDVCYGTGEFNRILEENGKEENLRQTIFKLLNDLQDEEEKRIKAVKAGRGPSHYTILSKYETSHSDVLEKFNTKATSWERLPAPTDYAILLAGVGLSSNYRYCTSEGERQCEVWNGEPGRYDYGCVQGWGASYLRFATRPVLPASETSLIRPSATKKGICDVDIAEYGEYPQSVADKKTSDELDKLLKSNSLKSTGKNYTYDSTGESYNSNPHLKKLPEYEYKGEKYVRLKTCGLSRNEHLNPALFPLSNGENREQNKFYWIHVEPIEWLMDSDGKWISKKALFAGIPFDTKSYEGDFEVTFLQKYLDTYFAKEMLPSQTPKRVQEKQIQEEEKAETKSPQKKPTLKSTLLRRTSSDKKKAEAIKAVKEILGR